MRGLAIVLLGLVPLSLVGCAADYVTQNQGDVIMKISGVSPQPLQSDVSPGATGAPVADTVAIVVAVRFKNLNLATPSVPNAVFLERYTVQYVRSDGRAVEGVDVPSSISGNLSGAIDVASSGGETFSIEVVRAQAKLEPPLKNLSGSVPGQLGGNAVLMTLFANITIYGRTVEGSVVSAQTSVQVDFGDF